MTPLILLLSMTLGDGIWTTKASGIGSPLLRQHVAINDGQIYLLDRNLSHVVCYDTQEGYLDRIIGAVDGAGIFPMAYRIEINQGQLVVHEFNGIHLFDLNRTYQETLNPPSRGGNLERLKKGWIVTDKVYTAPMRQYTVSYASRSMMNLTKLAEWQMDIHTKRDVKPGERFIGTPHNPAEDRGFVIANGEGTFAYFRPGGSNQVHIFDAAQRKVTHTIELSGELYPFDKAWGETQYEIYKAEVLKIPAAKNAQFYPVYPEKFPLVNDLFLGPDGNLVVGLWNTDEPGMVAYTAYDNNGQKLKRDWSNEFFKRVVKIEDEQAYIMYWDSQVGESGVAVVPLAQAEAYLKETTNSVR